MVGQLYDEVTDARAGELGPPRSIGTMHSRIAGEQRENGRAVKGPLDRFAQPHTRMLFIRIWGVNYRTEPIRPEPELARTLTALFSALLSLRPPAAARRGSRTFL